jgi:hypothetical protein
LRLTATFDVNSTVDLDVNLRIRVAEGRGARSTMRYGAVNVNVAVYDNVVVKVIV